MPNDALPPIENRARWWRGGLIFLVLALLGLLTFHADDAVQGWAHQHCGPGLKKLSGTISHYGDWPFLMIAGVVLGAAFWFAQRRLLTRFVVLMMIASTLAGLAANTLRLTTGRTRPNAVKIQAGWYGWRHEGQWLVGQNKYNSFPSGHTATAFGFFGLLLWRRRLAGLLLLLPAAIIGASRIVIDAHHFSDVYYGAWFGLLAAFCLATRRKASR